MKLSLSLSWVALCVLLSSCASPWIRRPEIDQIKKLAIVSIVANQRIKRTDGRGGAFSASNSNDWADTRVQLIHYASEIFTKALRAATGWKIIPASEIVRNDRYRGIVAIAVDPETEKAEAVMVFAKEPAKDFVTLPGMEPLFLTQDSDFKPNPSRKKDKSVTDEMMAEQDQQEQQEKLRQLAHALEVDAVALIQLQFSYRRIPSQKGGFIAKPMLTSELNILTKEGKLALQTDRLNRTKRFLSDAEVPVISGEMILEKAATPYKRLIDQNVNFIVERIKKEFFAS